MGCGTCNACEAIAVAIAVDGRLCPPDPCSDGVVPAQLTPAQAYASVANTTARVVDIARQSLVTQGFRPYNVDLVWSKWLGGERGRGEEKSYKRIAITPSPRVTDLTSINMSPVSTGVLPVGSLRLDRISACFTSDILMGRLAAQEGTAEPYDFYYEVYEDGRSGTSQRMKFKPASQPHRKSFGWVITIERISADAARDGKPAGRIEDD